MAKVITLRATTATGYTIEYQGEDIGTVTRSTRQSIWYFENDKGSFGSTKTRRAAIDALIDIHNS